MKTKNKVVVLMEIAVVLCSVFLVATLPGIAADQTMQEVGTTASEGDFTLEIYGNANEDDTIDMRDVTYIKLAIFGKKPETELADAYYDDEVDVLDVVQTKLIILEKESELTFVDYDGVVETVHLPVNRIVPTYSYHAGAVSMLGAKDRIVAVDDTIKEEKHAPFPDLQELPYIGSWGGYDIEKILELEPDIVLIYTRDWLTSGSNPVMEETVETADPDCTVFCLMPRDVATLKSEMMKLAYILGKKDAGDELFEWIQGYVDITTERVEGLSEDDKPRVFRTENYPYPFSGTTYKTFTRDYEAYHLPIEMAGGINIAADLPGSYIDVEAEWVTEQNPDLILVLGWGGMTGYSIDDPSEVAAVREDFMSHPGLKPTDAVKEGNVYVNNFQFDTFEWFIGLQYLAKWFHPELFEDIDPEVIHQEYLTEIRGLDYDLDEHGVFVYPPIEIDGDLAGIPDRYKGQI